MTRSASTSTATAMRSLRRKLTGVAIATVAVVLAATAIALLVVQRRALLGDVDDRLRERADRIEQVAVPAPGATIADLDGEDSAAQIVRLDGTPLAATENMAGQPAMAETPDAGETIRTIDDLPIEDDEYRVLSRRIELADGPAVLHVAENVDDIADAFDVLAGSLLVAFPVVLAVLGGLTWALVGRTIRPVAAAAARQEQFVGDASHELRAPLARMRARLEVDAAHPASADRTATATAVLDDAVAMQQLVDDLLVLARFDAAGPSTPSVLVDLDDLVLAEVRDRPAPVDVTVDVIGVSAGRVRGSRDELRRLVANLLDNAVRHARAQVAVSVAEQGAQVAIAVDDDGPGVPAGRREEVFARFTRVDAARSPGEGRTGLGLAIAREIAVRHGGRIDVADAPLGGARFTVTLPRA